MLTHLLSYMDLIYSTMDLRRVDRVSDVCALGRVHCLNIYVYNRICYEIGFSLSGRVACGGGFELVLCNHIAHIQLFAEGYGRWGWDRHTYII